MPIGDEILERIGCRPLLKTLCQNCLSCIAGLYFDNEMAVSVLNGVFHIRGGNLKD